MKQPVKPIVALLCLAGLASLPLLTQAEEKITTLKTQVTTPAGTQYKHHARKYHKHRSQSAGTAMSGKQLRHLITAERQYLPLDLDVPGQAFVSTGPYVGVPIQYAGSNLIINSPSVNNDVQLLEIRKEIHAQLHTLGEEFTKEYSHSHLLLSGMVEGQGSYTNRGGSPSTTDLDLSTVSIDAFFLGPSSWTSGLIELNYGDEAPASSVFTSNSQYRVSNSRIFVNKAFLTIGDFTQSPFYGTVGQFYVPFGTYSSSMVSSPLTKLLARTKARSLLVGFQEQGDNSFYGSAYIFRGDSHAASVSKVNNGGLNAGYRFKENGWGGKLGAGILANLADSTGMQTSNGFQNSSQNEQIAHRVPAYNLRGMLNLGEHVDLLAEYVGATTRFNPYDMSFNGRGAKPWAVNTEGAYSFYLGDHPSSVALGYGTSHEALSLGLPLQRYALTFNTSMWRNTLQSLEFRRDREYAASNTANGAGGTASAAETGKYDHAVTAQFDYYF